MLAIQLREWQGQRVAHLEALGKERRAWAELQTALGGLTLPDLEAATTRAWAHAARLDAGKGRFQDDPSESIADLRDRLQEAHQRQTEARERLAECRQQTRDFISQMPDVAAAREEHELAQKEVERLQGLDNVLEKTLSFLETAKERAHQQIAPVLSQTLNRWLPVVTRGRYSEAGVDPKTLDVSVRSGNGTWRLADQLSYGTAEQIYLLLRIALAEHLVKPGEFSPLILDDVTAQTDPERTVAILETLVELSRDRQIIFFSQESEVFEWANAHRDQANLIELRALEPA
jgi:uncharacterized protein YhaN